MKHPVRSFFIFILACSGVACSGEEDRYENIKKLRAIGAAVNPLGMTASTVAAPKSVTLTFYAARPKGTTVTAEPFIDEKAGLALPLLLSLVPDSEVVEEHASFDIYSVKATGVIPTEENLKFLEQQSFARLRYGMRLTAGSEEEKVVGNVLVYREGSKELQWSAPSVTVNNPVEGASLSGKQDISMNIDSHNEENFRVSWFVNDGKIKNRRGIATEFEPGNGGDYTIIATARGLKSGAFHYKVVDFKIE